LRIADCGLRIVVQEDFAFAEVESGFDGFDESGFFFGVELDAILHDDQGSDSCERFGFVQQIIDAVEVLSAIGTGDRRTGRRSRPRRARRLSVYEFSS
jgi:hypothetical protein